MKATDEYKNAGKLINNKKYSEAASILEKLTSYRLAYIRHADLYFMKHLDVTAPDTRLGVVEKILRKSTENGRFTNQYLVDLNKLHKQCIGDEECNNNLKGRFYYLKAKAENDKNNTNKEHKNIIISFFWASWYDNKEGRKQFFKILQESNQFFKTFEESEDTKNSLDKAKQDKVKILAELYWDIEAKRIKLENCSSQAKQILIGRLGSNCNA